MAGEMGGAAAGVQQADQDQTRAGLASIQALETMGKIAAQPGEDALRRAHTRLYNADATSKEAEAAQMAELARAAPGAFAGGEGGKPTSLADPFAKLARIAGNLGAVKKAEEFAKTAGAIALQEQQARTSASNQRVHEIDAKQKMLEQAGALAFYMSQSPENYAQGKMYLSQHPDPNMRDIGDLPEDFASARGQLSAIAAASTKAKDALAEQRRKLVADSQVSMYDARASASDASAAASTARARVLKLQEQDIVKHGGDTSAGAREIRAARRAALAEDRAAKAEREKRLADAQAARDRKAFPPPTPAQVADPSKLTVGQSYSTPKGVLTWTGKGWIPIRVAPVVAAPADVEDEEED